VRHGLHRPGQAHPARQDDREEAHDAPAAGTAKLSLEPRRLKRGAKVTVQATVTLADGTATTLERRISAR
jgi:hypothetical protein